MEDWADWGLDPLGTHDRTETFSHSVTPESPSMPAISAEKPVSCAEAPAAEPPVAAEPETPDMPAAETPAGISGAGRTVSSGFGGGSLRAGGAHTE